MELDWKKLEWKRYRRQLKPALVTATEETKLREGILLRVPSSQGGWIYSEIAPWPAFGTETVLEARDAVVELIQTADFDWNRYRCLPATAFALSQLLTTDPFPEPSKQFESTALGSLAILDIPAYVDKLNFGFRHFKWKLSQEAFGEQVKKLEALLDRSPTEISYRLDANRSIMASEWPDWKAFIESTDQISCLEEPFEIKPDKDLFAELGSKVALDESLVSSSDLADFVDKGWPGYYVIKPSLLGLPDSWISLLADSSERVILSSVFETSIGLKSLFRVALQGGYQQPMGLGPTDFLYHDGLNPPHSSSMNLGLLTPEEEVWEAL